jgi:hypothetical protein
MRDRTPTIYALLSQDQKDRVTAAMKEYNGTSIDEIFTDPEDFFQKVYRTKKTFFYYTRRAA